MSREQQDVQPFTDGNLQLNCRIDALINALMRD